MIAMQIARPSCLIIYCKALGEEEHAKTSRSVISMSKELSNKHQCYSNIVLRIGWEAFSVCFREPICLYSFLL